MPPLFCVFVFAARQVLLRRSLESLHAKESPGGAGDEGGRLCLLALQPIVMNTNRARQNRWPNKTKEWPDSLAELNDTVCAFCAPTVSRQHA